VLTLAAVAADKGISPQTIDVQIRRHTETGRPWRTHFEVQVDLGTGLTRREQIILYNSARHCEVHKLLTGDLSFDYALAE
jgi:hypothetical protein